MECNTVILCGGNINYTNLPIGSNTSNAMIPVNGRPVIGWILNDLLRKDINKASIVLLSHNHHLREFVERVYANRMQISFCELKDSPSILHSLNAGLAACDPDRTTRIILGDTLIRDVFPEGGDLVYLQNVKDSQRWCIAELSSGGEVVAYFDKQKNVPEPHLALCGYYQVSDTRLLQTIVKEQILSGSRQLSDLLTLYGKKKPIKGRIAEDWCDFGNIDNFIAAKQRLLQSRFFNSLTVDPVLNTITKVSLLDEKLRDELAWYKNLPEELKVLTPRIIKEEIIDNQLNLVQEYYGYPTLAELFLYSDLGEDTWYTIMRNVMKIQQVFGKYRGNADALEARKVYLDKTVSRLESLQRQPEWHTILDYPLIVHNNQELINIPELMEWLKEQINLLAESSGNCIIHGDLCFSNILFDINNQIIRLIDPRGSFGAKSIYGDPRYDIAKLRHSACGLYDFIVADLFEVRQNGNQFQTEIFAPKELKSISVVFDELVEEFGYQPSEIRLIEGLLFISMLPLHSDKIERQKMMYLTGLTILNDLYENRN